MGTTPTYKKISKTWRLNEQPSPSQPKIWKLSQQGWGLESVSDLNSLVAASSDSELFIN